MTDNTEPCPSCGRPTPVSTRCVYCATVTDLDLKSLQLDYMKAAEGDESELPKQVIVVVQKTGQKVPLKNRKVKIGRDPSNQVVIPDDTFTSRHHAWISYEESDFWLEDLGFYALAIDGAGEGVTPRVGRAADQFSDVRLPQPAAAAPKPAARPTRAPATPSAQGDLF